MKSFKKFTAFLLAFILLTTTLASTAFAHNAGDEIKWTYEDGNYFTVTYDGTLKEGKNKLEGKGSDCCAYEFEAAKSGYYQISYNSYSAWVGVAETYTDAKPVGYSDMLFIAEEENGDAEFVTYIPQGTAMFEIDFYEKTEKVIVEIEYFADKITSIDYSANAFKDMVLNYDIHINDGEFYSWIEEYDVNFSNGKSIKRNDMSLSGKLNGTLKDGENELTIELGEYRENVTATIYPITHYISGITVNNLEEYAKIYIYYDGDRCRWVKSGETITVSFTNGKSDSFIYGEDYYVTLANGQDYYIEESHFDWDTDEYIFTMSIADHDFIRIKCEFVTTSLAENAVFLKENIAGEITYIGIRIQNCFSDALAAGSIQGFFSEIEWTFRSISSSVNRIFDNISSFIDFCF